MRTDTEKLGTQASLVDLQDTAGSPLPITLVYIRMVLAQAAQTTLTSSSELSYSLESQVAEIQLIETLA